MTVVVYAVLFFSVKTTVVGVLVAGGFLLLLFTASMAMEVASPPGSTLAFAVLAAAALTVMALPGIGFLGLVLWRMPEVGESRALAAATVVVGSAGAWWMVFWLWAASPFAGVAIGAVAYVLGGVAVASSWPRLRTLGAAPVALLAVPLAVALMANGILFSQSGLGNALGTAQALYGVPDNWFPNEWVTRVLEGRDLQERALGGWPLVDRPPVQASLTLPVAAVTGDPEISSHVAGSILQGLGLVGIAVALFSVGARRYRLVVSGLLVALTPFVMLSTAYVWPKLFPSGLLLLAAAVFLEVGGTRSSWRRRKPDVGEGGIQQVERSHLSDVSATSHDTASGKLCGPAWTAVVALVAISLVAHPIGLLGIPLVAASWLRHPIPLPPWRWWAPIAIVPLLFAASWIGYRSFIDRTPSLLAQWHLAGVTEPSERSSIDIVVDSYRSIGVSGLLDQRLDNLAIFGGVRFFRTLGGALKGASFSEVVERSFGVPVLTPGILLLALPTLWWWRRLPRGAVTLLLGGGVSILFWLGLVFGPPNATAVTTHGPYAAYLAISAGLALAVVYLLPRLAALFVLVAQGVLWYLVMSVKASDDRCASTQMCVPFEQSVREGASLSVIALSFLGVGLLMVSLRILGLQGATRTSKGGDGSGLPAVHSREGSVVSGEDVPRSRSVDSSLAESEIARAD